MLACGGIAEEAQKIAQVAKLEGAQDYPLRLETRSFGEPPCRIAKWKQVREARLLLAERQAAEALVEACHLATGIEQLLIAAGPRRMHLRIDVEVQRVTFLAPGRARLELGAVGHFDVDRMIFGMDAGLHVSFPWVSCWFPTSGRRSERGPLMAG